MNSERDFVISGVHIGEHSFEPEAVIPEIRERCVERGMNFVTIRTRAQPVPEHYFYQWAQYLSENRIYFIFLYTIQHAPEGKKSHFTPEMVARMREIAGEYFLGDMIGEVGSAFACKMPGYYQPGHAPMPPQDAADMQMAKDNYIKTVSALIEIDRALGMPDIASVEATILNNYNLEAGVTLPMCELMCGNPELVVSALRGTARAYASRLWGTYIAHEWYGGMRHDDPLKQKRLLLAYRYAYMAGSNAFCLESGDEALHSYGYQYDADHRYCRQYADAAAECAERIRSDARPVGGPDVRVAFVQGHLDAFGGWGGSSVWSQFDRPEWSHGPAEHAWRIIDEIGAKRAWHEPANYGQNDLSALPGLGLYDILPAAAPAEVMARYDYLIFAGWNTMTDALYEKLEKYVEGGGRLFITAAHLNSSPKRDGTYRPIRGGDWSKLLGCTLSGEAFSSRAGLKFEKNSLIPELMYPGTANKVCDPIYSSGDVRYARVRRTAGTPAARLSDSFSNNAPEGPEALIENRLGAGTAVLLTSLDYPGHGALYPAYRAIVREMLSASHRACDIQVGGGAGLRFSVYAGGRKIYLLNTDYDFPINARVRVHGKTQDVTLEPLELKALGM